MITLFSHPICSINHLTSRGYITLTIQRFHDTDRVPQVRIVLMNLILFEPEEFTGRLPIRDVRAVHIRKILRLKPGDSFRCGIVDGPQFKGTITSISSDNLHYSTEQIIISEELYPITLLCGTPRPNSIRRIIRDSASFGISHIQFLQTDLGEKSYLNSHLLTSEKIRSYLIEGAAQAYGTLLPKVMTGVNLKGISAIGQNASVDRYIFDIQDDIPLAIDQLPHNKNAPMIIAIGSERGWSQAERLHFSHLGFKSVKLGPRIVRTDTAIPAALSLAITRFTR